MVYTWTWQSPEIGQSWLKFDDLSGCDVIDSNEAVLENDQGLPQINPSEIHIAFLCEEATETNSLTSCDSVMCEDEQQPVLPSVYDSSSLISGRRPSQSSVCLHVKSNIDTNKNSVKSAPAQIRTLASDNASSFGVSSVIVERMSLPERRSSTIGKVSKDRGRRPGRPYTVPRTILSADPDAEEMMIRAKFKRVKLYDP